MAHGFSTAVTTRNKLIELQYLSNFLLKEFVVIVFLHRAQIRDVLLMLM